jgi:hypothetical protein
MKALGRILIILFAAAVVMGGAYALLQTSAAQALVGQPMGVGGDRQSPPGFANGQDNQAGAMIGRPEGGREGSGLDTLGQNLLKIVAIVVAVQGLWSIGRWLRGKSRPTKIAAGG